jgi:endonuclease/exonuclease/phosphatase family metal-dependent hydrolase
MVVATWNLWGFGEPWRYMAGRGIVRGAVPGSLATTLRLPNGAWPVRRPLITDALAQVQPDLVGLQEVCLDPAAGIYQADLIAADLGLHCLFRPVTTSDYGGGSSAAGLAALTRFPITDSRELPLPMPDGTEQYAIHVIVPATPTALDVLIVHLTPRSEAAQVAAVHCLRSFLQELPAERTCLVMGDFNCAPESRAMQALTERKEEQRKPLRDAWQTVHPADAGPTMPSEGPVVRLDYVFVGPGLAVEQAQRLGRQPDGDGFYPSDHLGVAVTLSCSGESSAAITA